MEQQESLEPISTYLPAAPRPALWARTVTITWETAILILLGMSTLLSRPWILGARVMSHDETLHVHYWWLLATGKGFAHNPMMHGPLLFEPTAFVEPLFAANNFTSRLMPALLGTLVVIVVPQLARPWLGWLGSFCGSRTT